jgi:hypothetical protein
MNERQEFGTSQEIRPGKSTPTTDTEKAAAMINPPTQPHVAVGVADRRIGSILS